jgi:hypothetical protein
VLVTAQVVAGARLAAASHQRGWGFSSAAWQASPTLDRVRRLPEPVQVFSNVPELIYLHTGRQAEALPKRWLPMDRRPNPDFPAQMAAVERSLASESAVVVLFTGLRGAPGVLGERDLVDDLPVRVREQQPDGVVLCGVACPE